MKVSNISLLIALLAATACSINAASVPAGGVSGGDIALCLKNAMESYRKSTREDKGSATTYFTCFPSDFKTFMTVFGSTGQGVNARYAPLYDVAHDHILEMLPATATAVGRKKLFEKVIGIAVGAEWQADAANHLQELLRGALATEKAVFLEVLDRRSDSDIRAFWRFYDDGPHGSRGLPSVCLPSDEWRSCRLFPDRR